ncbi:MAG: 4-(cytidine 5'-diphospho)-2-C-methyl-D-erythritol kinase [Sphingobium sp.]
MSAPAETAYAKVNLALHVRARRNDGYHALESLFVFAGDGDLITAVPRDDGALTLTIGGPFAAGLDVGAGNLVIRAAEALRAEAPHHRSERPLGAAIHLDKRLPVASGIGGGSADAAAVLRLLTRLWRIDVPPVRQQALALSLGSDVPACLASRTVRVEGRGERLVATDVPGLAGMPMLLVNPGLPVSTAAVFAGWDRVDRGPLTSGSLDAIVHDGRNDLQPAAIRIAPVIETMVAMLGEQPGVRLARMSGSGATGFALFDSAAACRSAADAVRAACPGWWVMETRIRNG